MKHTSKRLYVTILRVSVWFFYISGHLSYFVTNWFHKFRQFTIQLWSFFLHTSPFRPCFLTKRCSASSINFLINLFPCFLQRTIKFFINKSKKFTNSISHFCWSGEIDHRFFLVNLCTMKLYFHFGIVTQLGRLVVNQLSIFPNLMTKYIMISSKNDFSED